MGCQNVMGGSPPRYKKNWFGHETTGVSESTCRDQCDSDSDCMGYNFVSYIYMLADVSVCVIFSSAPSATPSGWQWLHGGGYVAKVGPANSLNDPPVCMARQNSGDGDGDGWSSNTTTTM